MKKLIILLLLIILLFTSFGELLYSRSGSARFRNVKKWKDTIHYKLDLKEMFPDVIKNPDRESIAAEAFGIALPSSGSTLQGSYTDEKGGVFTWKLTPYN